MKNSSVKFLFVFVSLFLSVNSSFGEKVISSYTSSYFNKEYNIEASEIKNGKFSVYIQVAAEGSSNAMISLDNTELDKFNDFLQKTKEKYIEWSKVAKDNNITEMSKEMDFKSPSTTICWLGSKWWFSFGIKLQPRFLILDDGNYVVTIVKTVRASSNEYIDETIYLVFSTPEEIDVMISLLNEEDITAELQKAQNSSDLFK